MISNIRPSQEIRRGDDGVQQNPGGVQGAEQEQDQEAAGDCREAGHGRGVGADAGGRRWSSTDRSYPDRGRRGPVEANTQRHRAEARDVHQTGAEHQGAPP